MTLLPLHAGQRVESFEPLPEQAVQSSFHALANSRRFDFSAQRQRSQSEAKRGDVPK
jgi:hypothetical protein